MSPMPVTTTVPNLPIVDRLRHVRAVVTPR